MIKKWHNFQVFCPPQWVTLSGHLDVGTFHLKHTTTSTAFVKISLDILSSDGSPAFHTMSQSIMGLLRTIAWFWQKCDSADLLLCATSVHLIERQSYPMNTVLPRFFATNILHQIVLSDKLYADWQLLFVGSMDRGSSQQLQMWFSEHFFAPKLAA